MHDVLSKNEPELYEFLMNKLGRNFEPKELYNYIHMCSDKCKMCGGELEFSTLLNGYKNCDCEKKNIKTKKELYNYLCKYHFKYANRCNKSFVNVVKEDTIFKSLFDFTGVNTTEDLYLYLNDEKPGTCVICNKPTKFKAFKTRRHGVYPMCCSNECFNKYKSQRQMGKNNTYYRVSEETKKRISQEQSIRIKAKIKNGEFTSNVTNSWCHSMIKIKFIQNGVLVERKYRSSWETLFQLMNPDLLYEKLRLPYFMDGDPYTYIVDFIDYKNKQLYEIKPEKLTNNKKNKIKTDAMIKWANDNGYNVNIITEEYFIKNKFKTSLLRYTDDFYKEKLLKILRNGYKHFNIEYEN